jgi:hypothetical protein
MYLLELGSKIIIIVLFIGWPILAYFCYIWSDKIPEKETRYKISLMTSALTVFQYFFPVFLIFFLVSLIIYFIIPSIL